MTKKNLPIVTVPYEAQDLDEVRKKQALDMLGKRGKYLYVLPSEDDCIDAEVMIKKFAEFYPTDGLWVICAGWEEYYRIETAPKVYANDDHVVVVASHYTVTGSMLDKFRDWEIIFQGVPEIYNDEYISTSPTSNKWLSEVFKVEYDALGCFKIVVVTGARRLSVIQDDLLRPVARLHKFSKFGNALCQASWSRGTEFHWFGKWSVIELKAFQSITIYVENSPEDLENLEEFIRGS